MSALDGHVDRGGDATDPVKGVVEGHCLVVALPRESARGWLPIVNAGNPAATTVLADHASHTVGSTSVVPEW